MFTRNECKNYRCKICKEPFERRTYNNTICSEECVRENWRRWKRKHYIRSKVVEEEEEEKN